MKFLPIYLSLFFIISNVSAQGFEEISESVGVNQKHISFSFMGGGVAFLDFNNDGFEDLFVTGGRKRDKLFRNKGNGTFEDVGFLSGFVPKQGDYNVTSVTTGDINNDGFRDIFLTTSKNENNKLFLNSGSGSFINISIDAGITEEMNSMSAAFGDINMDGYLDIYVVNYVENNKLIYDENNVPIGYDHDCYQNLLYINNGDNTFSESAETYDVANIGCGLAVAIIDINNDHIPDIYIANDFGGWLTKNTSYINQYPEQVFTNESEVRGLDIGIFGMGIAVGDYNNDAFPDYYVTNLGRNVLLTNNGDGTFNDLTDFAGVANETAYDKNATGWGTEFFDFDNDGFEDLFVSNGYIPAAAFIPTSEKDPNKLYQNNGDGTFQDISISAGIAHEGISRGMAKGDFDNDGDMDLLVNIITRQESDPDNNVLLYENKLNNNNHWLKILVEGTENNIDGYGTKLIAFTGTEKRIREVYGGGSHASQSSSIQHFGFGETTILDSLKVIWPGGFSQTFYDISVNQTIYVKEGASYQIAGCTNEKAVNYNALATYNHACGEIDNSVTGIDNEISIDNIMVYPNPFSESFQFLISNPKYNYQKMNFKLFDYIGKSLISKELISEEKISIKGLKSGFYFYQLELNGKMYRGKIMKN